VSLAGVDGWVIGVPAALERMVTNIGITTLVVIVAIIGTEAPAAQHILFTLFSVAALPQVGFSIASTALVGQSVDAGDVAETRAAPAISLRWVPLWMLVATSTIPLLP
jgi:multidrug resistance protein, MATE family